VRVHAAPPRAAARVFAWVGAALFVATLVYFLFRYMTAFGVPTAGGDPLRAVALNVALFTVFAGHHSLFARLRVRAWSERRWPTLERSVYVWIASVLFFAVCALWRPVDGVAWSVDGGWRLALWLLQAAGIWVTLTSARLLDLHQLAGLRPATPAQGIVEGRAAIRASSTQTVGEGRAAVAPEYVQLTTRGPYGWVRHPIYAGWFLLVFAVSPMTMTRLVFAVVSCAYLLIAIPFEEASMRAAVPGVYDRYARLVRWRLIPGVY
jgi:hypothetical protein